MRETPYGPDLAWIHHIGFSGYSDLCGPGVIEQLDAVLQKGSTVLELGCGSGGLTWQLIDAGYAVIATDASPDMLDIARKEVPGADVRRLTLPDDPYPSADAVVSVGHTLNYLESAETIGRTLVEAARALRPGGVLILDLCDLEYGKARAEPKTTSLVEDTWAIISRTSLPAPDRFVREMTTFVPNDDGTWRRDDERHENILVDVELLSEVFEEREFDATVRSSFGDEHLPKGMRVLVVKRFS